jgi:predicted tellurium resistance membrane protein TerC
VKETVVDWLSDPQAWIALTTLTVLEVVLGIDNIIFISVLTGDLPAKQQPKARLIGLVLAMLMRLALLFSLSWLMRLTETILTVFAHEISGRDLILILGGLFLLAKSTLEIHKKVEGTGEGASRRSVSFTSALIQIMLLDIVFSLDSVITAIGMVEHVSIMVIAVVIAVLFMMIFVEPVHNFVERHPTVKMLALSFLLLIGMALVGEGLGFHIPKGYIYFAMGFSAFVELLNLRRGAKAV